MNAPLAFAPPRGSRWRRWLVYSPPARILIFFAIYLAVGTALSRIVVALGWSAKDASSLAHGFVFFVVMGLAPLAAYLIFVFAIERRAPSELALRRFVPDSAAGVAIGTALIGAVVGVLALVGSYRVVGTAPQADWLPSLLRWGLGAGIGEEILCRGVLFRIIEEGLGTFAALTVSALYFGAMHLNNPGATLASSVAVAIEGGVLFALLYHLTRSLYVSIGLHASWNFVQGTVFGIPISGAAVNGWLVSERPGPEWLSGGAFGAEASVVALLVCGTAGFALLVVAWRRGTIVPPAWRRASTI